MTDVTTYIGTYNEECKDKHELAMLYASQNKYTLGLF